MSATRHACPKCGKDRSYSFRWDSLYCQHCDVWLEPVCPKPETIAQLSKKNPCIHCHGRPEKPSERHGQTEQTVFEEPYQPD